MDIIAIASIVGAIISIITLFIPTEWKSKRISLILIVFVTVGLSTFSVNQYSTIQRIKSISKAANELVKNREMNFTDAGYIQAALAFLEQNKVYYPDTYNRAVAIYTSYKQGDEYSFNAIHCASELNGLIKGIAILNQVEK